MLKPQHLSPGDTVYVVASSRGGPGAVPQRYNIGKQQLEAVFGVKVIEGKHTLADPQRVYKHPEARAQDLMDGFTNPDVKAIISAIGGEESIRMLPFVDFDTIRTNPKILMGYSNPTSSPCRMLS